jgi:hypothetical protein
MEAPSIWKNLDRQWDETSRFIDSKYAYDEFTPKLGDKTSEEKH